MNSQSRRGRSAIIFFHTISLLLWLFVSLMPATGSASDPLALYLTWTQSPESTMVVRWLSTKGDVDDTVAYQAEKSGNWQSAKGSHFSFPALSKIIVHHVELSGLDADTLYFFRVGSEEKIYKFKTMPKDLSKPVRFIAGGDMYHDSLEILHETNRQAAKTAPDFALVGGDIAYSADKSLPFLPNWTMKWFGKNAKDKAERWLQWLQAWTEDMVTPDGRLIPFLPVLGNHDTDGRFDQTPKEAIFFYRLFAMPGALGYQVLDFGNYMSIFLLDSGHTHPIKGKQARWIRDRLAERSLTKHKFALYHVPAYPSVRNFNYDVSKEIRRYWVPSFDTYSLTAAFENHDHAYKRTFPLLRGAVSDSGVVYLGDGAWGVASPRQAKLSQKKWYLAATAAKRHFILMEITQDKRTMHAISSDGEVIDAFSW